MMNESKRHVRNAMSAIAAAKKMCAGGSRDREEAQIMATIAVAEAVLSLVDILHQRQAALGLAESDRIDEQIQDANIAWNERVQLEQAAEGGE